ncbi:hypothetical protein J4U01_gp045 [Mycobacterium phage Kumao]|uniref:Uncharacterized protein n=1 Tax=Mycobacterium phage Kumao TaxID=2041344 RepID=A0A2D1GPW5_9CAUD|nr:hypothetical protein J4U01_gp045 [Mycobacterium phage Kumao]ATN94008.1 hypothetical protein SEA_KUMAO_45 [Mycobacterium phage Kumao]
MNKQRTFRAKIRRLARKLGVRPVPRQDDVLVTLQIGRRLINEGWCKYAWKRQVNDRFQYDVTAAIQRSVKYAAAKNEARAFWAAYYALINQLPDGYSCLTQFNDNPKTTHQDVLDLYDRAIKAQGELKAAIEKGPIR